MSELSPVETRVLGALIEKSVTTPEYYPLTLNSLTLACNQKTSRFPVSNYDESEVLDALDRLRDKGLARRIDMAGSRVAKFRQVIEDAWEISEAEKAILCVLMLRGGQTLGEIRQRTDRLYKFESIPQVESILQTLLQREDFEPKSLVKQLPRSPRTKEIRYTYAWDEATESSEDSSESSSDDTANRTTEPSRLETLEARITALEAKVKDLEDLIA